MTDDDTGRLELTRRDAVLALAAAGVTVGAGATLYEATDGDDDPRPGDETATATADPNGDSTLDDGDVETLVAAAEVLYPGELDGIAAFVERFVRGREQDQPEHAAGIADAVAYLDEYAQSWRARPFATLDPGTREELLRDMQVDTLDADPEGSDAERVRYYVRNELLFALYTSPTGGELVGIENPQGYPGGTDSYQRGPRS